LLRERSLKQGQSISGRVALWYLIERYRLDSGQTQHIDMQSLMSLKFQGDLELFLDTYDNILDNLEEVPTEAMLHAVLVPQLRHCKGLQPDFVTYDAADDSDGRGGGDGLAGVGAIMVSVFTFVH
jgi:hypothetical protein